MNFVCLYIVNIVSICCTIYLAQWIVPSSDNRHDCANNTENSECRISLFFSIEDQDVRSQMQLYGDLADALRGLGTVALVDCRFVLCHLKRLQ